MRDIPNTNGCSTLQSKPKAKSMANTSTLTKVDYKSYKDFLESYQDNKIVKDDQESISSTDSGISYKLSENKSNHTSTSSLNSEINGNCVKLSQKFEQNSGFNGRTGSFRNYLVNYNNKKFSSVKPNALPKQNLVKSEIVIQVNDPLDKISNCNDQVDDAGYVSPSAEPEVPNYPPPPPLLQETLSVTEQIQFVPPPPPPPLPILTTTSAPKKWAQIKTQNNSRIPTSPEKHSVNNDAAANLAKILTQHLLPRRQALEELEKNKPPSNPPANNGQNKIATSSPALLKASKSFSYIPKPPQLPKPVVIQKQPEFITATNGRSSPNNNSVDYNTTTVVPVADGSAKVSKADPNVRKLVYNTYRGFLGAYNNKANDMIATLPRTMVREDQGVTKQLESIALQGGLEKLNGRINPNVEQE